jgi:hypothetical protein
MAEMTESKTGLTEPEAKALQTSLVITSVLYALPAIFFLMCVKTLQKDLVAR